MNKNKKERRRYGRYDTEVKIYFCVTYDVKTKIEFQVLDIKAQDKTLSEKYFALSKNVNAEALCFTSEKELEKGDILYMEVYLPSMKTPIHMKGRVRWSRATSLKQKTKNKFDTGVKLISVNGKSVPESVYYDEANQVFWSIALDSVFGSFGKLTQQRRHIS